MKIKDRKLIVIFLKKRDGDKCQHPDCGMKFTSENPPTIDHWYPLSAGGSWDLENLRLMHKKCNTSKGSTIPLDETTLPVISKKERVPRAVKRENRPQICNNCLSGRLLGPEEECDICGSGPMPPRYPQWAKMKPNDCTHEGIWWCWCCMSGVVDRMPASRIVFDGGEPGID